MDGDLFYGSEPSSISVNVLCTLGNSTCCAPARMTICKCSLGHLGWKDCSGLHPMAQQVKNPPAIWEMQETRVQSLDQEDPLNEEMATHSSFLAWKIPWTEQSGGLQSTGSQRAGHDWSDLACRHVLTKVPWFIVYAQHRCMLHTED